MYIAADSVLRRELSNLPLIQDQFVRRSSWRDSTEPTHCPLCNNYLQTLPTFVQTFLARNTNQAQDSQSEEPPDSRVLQEEQWQRKLTEIEEKLKEARIMCDNIWERLDRAHTGLGKYINKIIQYWFFDTNNKISIHSIVSRNLLGMIASLTFQIVVSLNSLQCNKTHGLRVLLIVCLQSKFSNSSSIVLQ